MQDFDYNIFDRQMRNLLIMSKVFVDGREDSGSTELSLDLRSLCEKASRLCSLADEDIALQQNDLLHHRRQKNVEYHAELTDFVRNRLVPFIVKTVKDMYSGKGFGGVKSSNFPMDLPTLLPRLASIIKTDDGEDAEWNGLMANIDEVEKLLVKKVKLAVLPGMPDAERLWLLMEYYTLMCYLLFHFQRAVECVGEQLSSEDVERMFTSAVLWYQNSDEGRTELERYYAVLMFNHGSSPFSTEELDVVRKSLINDVPQKYQLCFARNINIVSAFANDFYSLHPSMEEYVAMIVVVAKYQLISQKMYELKHPETIRPQLYNEVFNPVVKGRPVDMSVLREKISRMLRLVSKKNHWFCIWCVLKHHNLLRNDSLEAFARQMMDDDWFRNDVDDDQRVKGDNLRDYVGYLSQSDYTKWNRRAYNDWRQTHKKTKLSADLSDKFMRLCMEMDEEFEAKQ